MKNFTLIVLQLLVTVCLAQPQLPFYYEQNLPLFGQPSRAEEFYYEYHTQAKAHYYSHHMSYDRQGRIKTHVKTNVGLLDSIPPTFQDIIDPRPVTITYSFTYDTQNRYSHFVRQQYQEEVGTFQQDEVWKYDDHGMLSQHQFLEVNGADTVIKNPSSKRVIYRDDSQKVIKLEKYSYSFSEKGLVLSEIITFGYLTGKIDTINTYQVDKTGKALKESKYRLTFQSYNDLNTDSLLLLSYFSSDALGDVTKHAFSYDSVNRMLQHAVMDSMGALITHTDWRYEAFKTTESTDGHYRLEIYNDETGYERYREEFENNYSLATPADKNTRTIENGKIDYGLLEIWDPVTLFYRKDTEYFYSYDDVTALPFTSVRADKLALYPNPSSGTVYLSDYESIEQLELSSLDGKTMSLTPSAILHLDLPQGIYLLNARRKEGSYQSVKLLVK